MTLVHHMLLYCIGSPSSGVAQDAFLEVENDDVQVAKHVLYTNYETLHIGDKEPMQFAHVLEVDRDIASIRSAKEATRR